MVEQNTTQKDVLSSSPPPSDWTIGELYSRSWEIIKKHKVLWLFGMAVAGIGSSASNIRFDRLVNLIPDSEKQKPVSNEISQASSNILGTSATASFGDIWGHLVSTIPTYFYIIGGIELVLLIILGIIIGVIGSAWANAALIEAIQAAIAGGNVTIRGSSEKAFGSIKSLVWLAIIPTLILVLASLVIFPILAIPLIIGGLTIKVLGGFVLAIAVLIWIVVVIFLSLAQIWAPREVVIDKKPAREALFASIKIARRKFWSMLLLGLVNLILGAIVFGVLFGIPLGLAIGGTLSLIKGNLSLGIGLVILGGLPFLLLLLISILPSGILTAFKATVWTIAYNNIRGKYDKS